MYPNGDIYEGQLVQDRRQPVSAFSRLTSGAASNSARNHGSDSFVSANRFTSSAMSPASARQPAASQLDEDLRVGMREG